MSKGCGNIGIIGVLRHTVCVNPRLQAFRPQVQLESLQAILRMMYYIWTKAIAIFWLHYIKRAVLFWGTEQSSQRSVLIRRPHYFFNYYYYFGSEWGCTCTSPHVFCVFGEESRLCLSTYVCVFHINAWTTSKKSHLTFRPVPVSHSHIANH